MLCCVGVALVLCGCVCMLTVGSLVVVSTCVLVAGLITVLIRVVEGIERDVDGVALGESW